jgi:AcrR family transcriptional regulator
VEHRDTRIHPLERTEIARAALALVDADGIEHFTMRRVAEELGVTTMAVYHHFQNKAEVLQAAADQVWIEALLAVVEHDDPVESIIQGMLTVRRVFRAHPDITTHAFSSHSAEDAMHLGLLGTTSWFERAGLRGEAAGRAYFALATFTLGSALIDAERNILDRGIRRSVSDLGAFDSGDLAITGDSAETYQALRDAMADDPDLARFERGLRDIMTAFHPGPAAP